MAEVKKCKYCKEDIAKDAKICPNCRKKQKSKKWIIIPSILVVVIAGAAATSGSSKETSGKIDSLTSSSMSENSSKYTIGEYVEKDNIKVSFISMKTGNGTEFFNPADGNTFVYAEFEIENNSDKELTISSLMSFDSYFDGYSTDISITAESAYEDAESLDGTIAPGKKIKGILGYEVSCEWKEYEVNVTPDFWKTESITFTAKSEQIG